VEPTATACRVVVCDDQPAFRELIAAVIGFDTEMEVVGEAADGRQAIEVVRSLRPDVLVLDLAMPELDGIEALPHIREASPDTRVIIVTGFGSASVKQRALDAGATLFVEKGTDVDELVGQIKALCPS
jgi:DNA-binding NarL/FixJ family response regulator